MRRLQFSIRETLLSTALIGSGLGMFMLAPQLDGLPLGREWGLPVLLSACALVGAGCGAPLRAKAVGAVLGFGLGLIGLFVLLAYVATQFHR